MGNILAFKKNKHIASISFNKPLSSQLAVELRQLCNEIKYDRDIYVVLLSGEETDAFCSDGEFQNTQPHGNLANEIANIDVPVIAAINGDALGYGMEIALACDIRIVSDTAHFGLPQITRGDLPCGGGTQRLPRLVGRGKALELLLTGDIIDANEALQIGLIHRIIPAPELMPEAEKIANNMAAKGLFALKYAKEAVLKGMDMTLKQGLRLEADLYMLIHTTQDRTEGIRAFQQKRPPDFQGK